MKRVYINRGIPGSGKSNRAHWLTRDMPGAVICSADDYFTAPGGTYFYLPECVGLAHAICLLKYVRALENPTVPLIVVDNTNITAVEIAPYYALAEAYGAEAEIVTVDCNPIVAYSRNIHGVPQETIESMAQAIPVAETLFPESWKHSHIRSPDHLSQEREALEEMTRLQGEHPVMGPEEEARLAEWGNLLG